MMFILSLFIACLLDKDLFTFSTT